MMRQYMEIKNRYRDCILFFRMGDFYEMFFEDAEIASRVLNIALTTRDRTSENPAPMCGVPFHSAGPYIRKLLEAGYRVAVCEQLEEPGKGKKIVTRDVVRVYSPGVDYDFEEEDRFNYVFAVVRTDELFGYAYADVSTRLFRAGQVKGVKDITDMVERLNPAEIIMLGDPEKPHSTWKQLRRHLLVRVAEQLNFPEDADFALRMLMEKFKNDITWLKNKPAAAIAAAGLLHHVMRFALTREVLDPPQEDTYGGEGATVDAATLRNLEVFQTLSGDKKGSVYSTLCLAVTSGGKRVIRDMLSRPLKERKRILQRLSAIEELYREHLLRSRLREYLSGVPDAERIMARINAGTATPADLAQLRRFLQAVPLVKSEIENLNSPFLVHLRTQVSELSHIRELLEKAIVETPPSHMRDGGVINPDFDEELKELHRLREAGGRWIAEFEAREKERTGIPTLKVGYNRVFGYYIEISKGQLSRVPPEYERRQTLVSSERFITPELKEWEEKILTSSERIVQREKEIYERILRDIKDVSQEIFTCARALFQLDAIAGLAEVADRYGYVKPEIVEEPVTEIVGGRHPAMERLHGSDAFIPLDVSVSADNEQILIITGPNMAGKSTVLRTAALIQLMGQAGFFVPAEKAVIGIADRITSRIGASDDITRGKSTFMVEMEETAEILRKATRSSFIILDEIGRGTSTYDGISIAWAVVEYIHDTVGARTLCATHYHELTEVARLKPRVVNYTMEVREYGDELLFMYRLVRGRANRSYGVHVARLAALPPDVLQRAEEILRSMEEGVGVGKILREARQLELFSPTSNQVLQELVKIDVGQITPLEAINLLYRLQEKAKQEQ